MGYLDIFRNVVNGLVNESTNNPNKLNFILDEISKITFNNNRCIVINEGNNWLLKPKNWEINNYERFLKIIQETPKKYKGYLTFHGMDEITSNDWITYTLKGHDVAFALHYISPGRIELCNFVNNSDLRNIGDVVLQFAKSEGANEMDNYRGFKSEKDPKGNGKLGNLYRKAGFNKQTWHDIFRSEFQPDDPEWQLDPSNKSENDEWPDVEGLARSKHCSQYKSDPNYKQRWDKRFGSKFKK